MAWQLTEPEFPTFAICERCDAESVDENGVCCNCGFEHEIEIDNEDSCYDDDADCDYWNRIS